MTQLSTADLLKYADLQMAAEAFLVLENGATLSGTDLIKAPKPGVNQSLKSLGSRKAWGQKAWGHKKPGVKS